jgi:hypothetical protein
MARQELLSSKSDWGELVKQCESRMDDASSENPDSYKIQDYNSSLVATIQVGPHRSEFLNCLGDVLAIDAPDEELGMSIVNDDGWGANDLDNFEISYGNLKVRTVELDKGDDDVFQPTYYIIYITRSY